METFACINNCRKNNAPYSRCCESCSESNTKNTYICDNLHNINDDQEHKLQMTSEYFIKVGSDHLPIIGFDAIKQAYGSFNVLASTFIKKQPNKPENQQHPCRKALLDKNDQDLEQLVIEEDLENIFGDPAEVRVRKTVNTTLQILAANPKIIMGIQEGDNTYVSMLAPNLSRINYKIIYATFDIKNPENVIIHFHINAIYSLAANTEGISGGLIIYPSDYTLKLARIYKYPNEKKCILHGLFETSKNSNKTIISVASIHAPYNSTLNNVLNDVFISELINNAPCVILGDFNADCDSIVGKLPIFVDIEHIEKYIYIGAGENYVNYDFGYTHKGTFGKYVRYDFMIKIKQSIKDFQRSLM